MQTRMTMPVQPSYDTEAAQSHLPAQAGGKPPSCTPFTLCAPDNSLSSVCEIPYIKTGSHYT